jgi:GH24 family phage-related lysozyme (muramidase)
MEVINEGILKALEMLGLGQPQQGGGVLSAVAGMPRPEGKPSAPDTGTDRFNYITDFIAEREDFIPEARVPTKGDVLTIGYGRTEGVKPGDKIDKVTGKAYLKEDIMKRLPEVERAIPGISNYPMEIQAPLVSEWFRGSLVQSPKTRKLIKAGKFEEASKEFLNNDEYKNAKKRGRSGIRGRMEETALAIRNMGQFNER